VRFAPILYRGLTLSLFDVRFPTHSYTYRYIHLERGARH